MRLPQPEKSSAQPGLLILFVVLALVIMTVWFREGRHGPVHRLRGGVQVVAAPVGAAGEFVTRPVARPVRLGVGPRRVAQPARDAPHAERRAAQASLRARRGAAGERAPEGARRVRPVEQDSSGRCARDRPTDQLVGGRHHDRPRHRRPGSSRECRSSVLPGFSARPSTSRRIRRACASSRTPARGVAAMLQSERAEGIVRGSIDGKLTLDFVSTETTVRAGRRGDHVGYRRRLPEGAHRRRGHQGAQTPVRPVPEHRARALRTPRRPRGSARARGRRSQDRRGSW